MEWNARVCRWLFNVERTTNLNLALEIINYVEDDDSLHRHEVGKLIMISFFLKKNSGLTKHMSIHLTNLRRFNFVFLQLFI